MSSRQRPDLAVTPRRLFGRAGASLSDESAFAGLGKARQHIYSTLMAVKAARAGERVEAARKAP
jgi:hypothetical protein